MRKNKKNKNEMSFNNCGILVYCDSFFFNSNTNIRELMQKAGGNNYTLVCNKCS